jgi:CRISPR-associated protein Csh1
MIEAIHSLGQYALQEKDLNLRNTDHLTKILIEDPASSPRYKKILKINLKKNGDNLEYNGIIVDEYDSGKIEKYLYRKGSSSGTDYSPTARITDPKRTFEKKILKWFQLDYSDIGLNRDEETLVKKMGFTLDQNHDRIVQDIVSITDGLKREKENAILTVELSEDYSDNMPGDLDVIKKVFVERSLTNYYEKYNKTSISLNSVCSVCGKENAEVYGFVSTYAFYTVDKPGMVAGGFDQSKAWKNYPVCKDCALVLEEGKQWLERYSSFNFYGFDYLLIPKPLRGEVENEVYQILEEYQRKGSQVRVTGTYEALLDATNEEVLGLLSDKPNTFLCNMLIYQASPQTSEFKIRRYIEGVYPADLKRLFEAKKKVDADVYIGDTMVPAWENGKKTGEKHLTYDFGCFWYFLKEEAQSKYFLNIVNDVFKGNRINRQFLMGQIVQQVRKNHANGYSIKEPVMRGMCCLLYLDQLGLLDLKESEKMSEKIRDMFPSEGSSRVEAAEKIFKEYPRFFKGDPEKAVFIVGVLSQLLMNIQYRNRGATPFRSKLQGLKLDEKKVKTLLPEIQNKLEEYESNYYRDLETLVSEYFIQAQDEWSLSRDEISFYFALGMNLSKYFRSEKEEKKDE